MIIDFDQGLACSIKSLAVNKNNVVKPTSRFFNERILMFTKLSLTSFVYELIETFYILDENVIMIYEKYMIEKIYPYHVLTDTDSTCLVFVFICKLENNIPDEQFRDKIFAVIVSTEIANRFNRSHKFWEKFSVRNETLKKKL